MRTEVGDNPLHTLFGLKSSNGEYTHCTGSLKPEIYNKKQVNKRLVLDQCLIPTSLAYKFSLDDEMPLLKEIFPE